MYLYFTVVLIIIIFFSCLHLYFWQL